MGDLKVYRTFVHGNIDESEIIKIKIYTHNPIGDYEIKQINTMRLCDIEKIAKSRGWQVQKLYD